MTFADLKYWTECKTVVKRASAVLAVLNEVSVGLAYIVSQGNITATIIWFAITTGATAGLGYHKKKETLFFFF
ncbi:MAG: hypothetical protein ACFFCW_23810 [Candidatus Hodarchaeota archaeon]